MSGPLLSEIQTEAGRGRRVDWSRQASLCGWVIVAAGTLLRLRQYLVDRSLWRDEAALVYNLLHRGYLGFTKPLAFEQGTPAGFYVVEKAVSQVFGTSELALRAVPLVCGVGALVLAFLLVRRHLDAPTGLVALVLCATSPSLIYFASEVKQYSTDALVALVILLATSTTWRRDYDRRSCLWLALAGMVGLLFSHAALFVLVGVGPVLACPLLRPRDLTRLRRLIAVGAAWVATWVVVYLSFDRNLQNDAFLRNFWSEAFLPIPPTTHDGLHRWSSALSTLFGMLSGNDKLVWLLGPLAIVGIVSLWRRERGVLIVLVVPWVTVVVASSRQLYPATERLVLFLIPFLAVVVAAGTVAVANWAAERMALLGPAIIAVVLIVSGSVALHRFGSPQPVEELRPLLEQLHAQVRPGDTIYVAETAVPAFDYYEGRLGFAGAHVVLGSASIDDTRGVMREVAPLAGSNRVWLVTSAYWQPEGQTTPEISAVFDQLGRRVSEAARPGSMVSLYDLQRRPEQGG